MKRLMTVLATTAMALCLTACGEQAKKETNMPMTEQTMQHEEAAPQHEAATNAEHPAAEPANAANPQE